MKSTLVWFVCSLESVRSTVPRPPFQSESMVVAVSAVLPVAQTRDAMMALRFALLLPTACAVLLFRRAQHAGQRMQFLDHQGGLSADQVEAGWEAPVLPLCGDLVADPVGGQAQDQGDAGWEAPVVADPVGGQAQDDAGWEAPVVADPVGGQAPKKGRAGRKRKAWTEHESVQKTEKLRKAALSWLKGHDKVHKVPGVASEHTWPSVPDARIARWSGVSLSVLMATCWWKSRGNATKIRTKRPSEEVWPNSSQCPRHQLRHRRRWRPWGFPGRRGLQHGSFKISDHGEQSRFRNKQQIAFALYVPSCRTRRRIFEWMPIP